MYLIVYIILDKKYIRFKHSIIMKKFIVIIIILLSACSQVIDDTNLTEKPDKKKLLENKEQLDDTPSLTEGELISLTNAGSGSMLESQFYDAGSEHTVILVQGGTGSMASFQIGKGPNPSMVQLVNNAGYNALIFNPDGRGKSEGEEDYNGYISQDALYAVYEYAESKGSVGIASFSYGVAMVSGMLGRYNVTPEYYIEWEGPVDRYYVTVNCTGGAVKEGVTCDDDEYWNEREAINFVADWNINTFIILQGTKDHVQPSWQHSIDMNNEAVNHIDYVQINMNTPNTLHTIDSIQTIDNIDKEEIVIKTINKFLS